MTLFTQIDLMARGASIALFVLWSWVLLRDHRDVLAARVAVAMNVAIIGYLTVTITGMPRDWLGLGLSLLAGSTPGLFWLLARTWFSDRTTLGRWPLVVVALTIINIAVMQLSFGQVELVNLISGLIFHAMMFAFAIAGLWEAWRSWEGDLVETRRATRPYILAAVGIYVMIIAASEMAVNDFGAPGWINRSVQVSIILITLPFVAAIMGMRQAELFGVRRPASGSSSIVVDDALTARLMAHMADLLPHRDEEMTIAKLAAQLGEQEYRLRRHINGALGHRNFASFLNGYRLAEVKAALADAGQKEVPIITIALDAGFGSLGPFNRAFREAEGMTPSAYRARMLALDPPL
jgi:AraC-like DNA-binding protein